MKRSPMPKRRTTKRRVLTPRCASLRCNKPGNPLCVTHTEQRADRLFSIWVRERDEGCTFPYFADGRYPVCEGPLQAAHGEPRVNHAVRYDPRNVHALCRTHHMLVDRGSKHALKRVWLIDVLGRDVYDSLMDDALILGDRLDAARTALAWLEVSEAGAA